MSEVVDNYFDVDLYYGLKLKVKVKMNYFVVSLYLCFIVYGSNGLFIKYGED